MQPEPAIAGARGVPAPFYGLLYLPQGMPQGFATVTLGYVLTHNGFGVAAVAAMVALHLLPATWKFLMGPVLDLSLTPRAWYLVLVGALLAQLGAYAVLPLTPPSAALLTALAFGTGVAATATGSALIALVAATVPPERRGAVAGYAQSGNLGGIGVGGGLGLWAATHYGVPAAVGLLALVIVLAALPILWVRTPPREAGLSLASQLAGLWSALFDLARTRSGVLALVVVTLPAALGAAAGLLSAVAGDWKASADLVALVTGVLGGLVTIPGCIAGGYLCDRFAPRVVYVVSALACAAGEAAMALAPHTPAMFAAFVLGNSLLLGAAWGSVSAVIYEQLGRAAAATVGAVLASLCNLPVLLITVVVGWAQKRGGADAMLLTEAGLAVASMAAFSLLAFLWRSGPRAAAQAAA